MWDLILSVPDRCLSFYFGNQTLLKESVISFVTMGDRKVRFVFRIQRKVRILSQFCDVHIEIKFISSNSVLFEKQF